MSEPWLLAIDTATSIVTVAAGTPAGTLIEARTFPAEHRHGSHLLPTIARLARDRGMALADLDGVIVGTGPGAFTGLRVGLATAKVLAHELAIPLVGVATSDALLAADDGATAVLLPAGPHDRTIVERGVGARLLAGDDAGAEAPGVIAVDLAGRASEDAVERGRRSLAELPGNLLALGAARLRAGEADDVDRLVPAYVSLPRGVTHEVGEEGLAWSRDPR
jgi:tRNA threonylcarbamoyl adenosine modification protein YeaZ